jgi:hypothetical protein
LIVGIGLWTIWIALLADPALSLRQVVVASLVLGLMMAFTHPSTGAMSLLFLIIGLVHVRYGRPFPRRVLAAAAAMAVSLLVAYELTSTFLPPTNPSIIDALGTGRYDYVDLGWMLATLFIFPMLAALWLLQLAPGIAASNARWYVPWPATAVVGGSAFGLPPIPRACSRPSSRANRRSMFLFWRSPWHSPRLRPGPSMRAGP